MYTIVNGCQLPIIAASIPSAGCGKGPLNRGKESEFLSAQHVALTAELS